jgi:acid stress-induced BolA-like protein IbaG/YrbA
MNSEQLTEILKATFPHAEVVVSGQAESLTYVLSMISLKVNVLLLVNKCLCTIKFLYRSGEVHAVTIRAMTKEEWRKASLFGA